MAEYNLYRFLKENVGKAFSSKDIQRIFKTKYNISIETNSLNRQLSHLAKMDDIDFIQVNINIPITRKGFKRDRKFYDDKKILIMRKWVKYFFYKGEDIKYIDKQKVENALKPLKRLFGGSKIPTIEDIRNCYKEFQELGL